ncbi:MAG: hypothetical protein Tsb0021_08160 [Chlamydiales bacterium]
MLRVSDSRSITLSLSKRSPFLTQSFLVAFCIAITLHFGTLFLIKFPEKTYRSEWRIEPISVFANEEPVSDDNVSTAADLASLMHYIPALPNPKPSPIILQLVDTTFSESSYLTPYLEGLMGENGDSPFFIIDGDIFIEE